jgi:hypothetical protein
MDKREVLRSDEGTPSAGDPRRGSRDGKGDDRPNAGADRPKESFVPTFGYRRKTGSERIHSSTGRPIDPGKAAAELARRHGLPDADRLLHQLHCLADEWETSTVMGRLADQAETDGPRLRVHGAVTHLIAELDRAPLCTHLLGARLRREHWLDHDELRRALAWLHEASARPLCDAPLPPELVPRRHDSDERRRWLVLQLRTFYELETGKRVCAYVDDGQPST